MYGCVCMYVCVGNLTPLPPFFFPLSPLPLDPCGTSALVATNHTQTIESPGYPNQYQASTRCRWTIAAPEDSQGIHIEFTDMNLESSARCAKDYLEISKYFGVRFDTVFFLLLLLYICLSVSFVCLFV